MTVLESIFHFLKMTMLFNAIRSPKGAQRIPVCYAENEQSQNTLRSFQATLIAFVIYFFVSGCAIQTDKTTIVANDCEQACSVISAAKKHALKGDQAFLMNNHLYSVTNSGNVWEVRFQANAPLGMVMLGGGVTFLIDGKTLSVINTLYEQ